MFGYLFLLLRLASLFRVLDTLASQKSAGSSQSNIFQIISVFLLVDELLDVLEGTARSAIEDHTGVGLGGLILVALILVNKSDALAGWILLHSEGTLLDGTLESWLVDAFWVERVSAEKVTHASSLQQKGGRVSGDEPVQVGGGVDYLDHFGREVSEIISDRKPKHVLLSVEATRRGSLFQH